MSSSDNAINIFEKYKDQLLSIDPVYFCEKYLTLDGAPFRLSGNGYKPFADIYRYVGLKALEPNSKPIVIVKGRQVGATTMASAIEAFFMASGLFGVGNRPPMRIMHCFPTLAVAYAYTKTKLNTLISSSVILDEGKGHVKPKSFLESKLDNSNTSGNSLQFKQFVNNNHIWVESTGLNGDRLRGRTVDAIFFDECQDIPSLAIGAATKALTKARYGKATKGIQVYFGTPKQKGTGFQAMWNMSSQQYYYLGCEKCKDHFPLYTPESDEWENIWIEGEIVRCTKCGHHQNKLDAAERGKWIAANPDPDCKFVGFHINQLYTPGFTKEDIINEKPEHHPTNSERIWNNEVLGEFYSGEGSPLNIEDIHKHHLSSEADLNRKFRANIPLSEEKRVYLGLDWGERANLEQHIDNSTIQRGKSYSCAVILVPEGPKLLSVQFATRLKRNDLQYKKDIVEQLYRQYSVSLGVGDIGYANDLSTELHLAHGDKFLASRAANLNAKVKLDENFPKTIVFDREHYIDELISLLKNGFIRFPYGDYEKIAWLLEHCCSMEIKVTSSRSGEPIRRFVKGSKPNDGFMALLNAYLAYKFDISNGFKINHPNSMNYDINQSKGIPAILGYIPRM